MFVLSICYIFLPMQKINEMLFPVDEIDETEKYQNACLVFETVS